MFSRAKKEGEETWNKCLENSHWIFLVKGNTKYHPINFSKWEMAFLPDVRSKEEADSISIAMKSHPNIESKSIPVHEIPDRLNEVPNDKPVGVFYPANVRSTITYAYLLPKGFLDVRIIDGGYADLTEALTPVPVLKALQSKK
jgi:rhodanese-related sulfurtransferase